MKDGNMKILSLAPLAVREAERILRDPKASVNAQIQVIDLILNRTYGRPAAVLMLENGEGCTQEAAAERVKGIIERIQSRRKEESDDEE